MIDAEVSVPYLARVPLMYLVHPSEHGHHRQPKTSTSIHLTLCKAIDPLRCNSRAGFILRPLSSWLSFNNLHVCAEDQVVYHSLSASKPQSVHQDISASQKKAESNQTLILEQTHEGFAAERIPAQPLPAARHTIYRSLHCLHLLQ